MDASASHRFLSKAPTVYKHHFITLLMLTSFFFSLSARDIDLNRIAIDTAKQKKTLLVWLHKNDCGYCEAMYEFTLGDDKVSSLIQASFELVDININDDDTVMFKEFRGSGHDFAKHVGYNFYPSSLFLDADGEIIFAAPGYVEEKDFFKMLDYVSSGAHKSMTYDSFNREGKK
ncbi:MULTISPECIES: thioredoxin family protein [Sulfurimonas]|uniref:Thioredoxin fold domain-containing protein n=1 Tax=Sulfurimonas diazotrophicus TaxID=3131939 RepID=A0ABZ3H922_9BACT